MDSSAAAEARAQPRRVTDRERFLTFALAAAELLVEVLPDGRIDLAIGAFQSHFGLPPDSWHGRGVRELIALQDRADFDLAFGILLARNRLVPTAFRLSSATAMPVAVSGLRLLGQDDGRMCLTIAATPGRTAAAPHRPGQPAHLVDAATLQEAASAEARASQPRGTLGLLEIQGGTGAAGESIAALIRRTLTEALAADSLAGEFGAGRYGILCPTEVDIGALGLQLEALLLTAGHTVSVATSSLGLNHVGLTAMQATRALRYALSAFADGGTAAVVEAGFDAGLGGFVAAACTRGAWLRRAIAENRFSLIFQPIVALASGEVQHFEALLRPDPEPGNADLTPQNFVAFAETIGLSEELDWAVLGSVCAAARRARSLRIAANLSGLTLQSPAFRDRLLDLLDAEPLLTHRLMLEITETAEITDEAEAMTTIAALRDRGVPLCIDDFGAGAAAFRYLRLLRVDYVKIDGIFVTNAIRSPKDRVILASMVELIHGVGALVIAEHVETEEEAALMRDLGVDFGQGWLHGRPGPLPGG